MIGYDYGNARLRGMKARLLDESQYRKLLQADDVGQFLVRLGDMPYAPAVEEATVRADGLEAAAMALRRDLSRTAGKMRRFYRSKPQRKVDVLLRRYDVENVITVLRGVDAGMQTSEIRRALLPLGRLSENLLVEMAKAADTQQAVEILASTGLPVAAPVLRADDVPGMERELRQWYIDYARRELDDMGERGGLIDQMLEREADQTNIMMALRFAQWGEPLARDLLVAAGDISPRRLEEAAAQSSVEQVAETLIERTRYSNVLEKGLAGYQQEGRLSAFEQALDEATREWQVKQIYRDPLGIGVPMGYLALKVNEVRNLRWIAAGIALDISRTRIEQEITTV